MSARAALLAIAVTLAGCIAELTTDEAVRLDRGLGTYVKLVPKRADMDVAELASHDLLGVSLLETTGRLSGRSK